MEVIVTCYPASERHLQRIADAMPDALLRPASDNELPEAIRSATILCGHVKVPVPWDQVVAKGNLRWIQSTAAGLDHCLVDGVLDSPIVVSSASGVFADQVAEQTLALLLGLLRGLPSFFRAQLRREFHRLPTADLHGKNVAIIGYGGNGRRIAKLLQAFRCHLMATDFFASEQQREGDVQIWPANAIRELLPWADIVIVTLPLTGSTRHWIGPAEFAAMKPGAWFINVGRGPTVDEAALCDALESRRLAGAGLDVVEHEPLPADSPLWQFENLLITPHVGAQSARRLDDVTELFCRNLKRWQRGEPLWNVVDKRLGFPKPQDRLPMTWRTG